MNTIVIKADKSLYPQEVIVSTCCQFLKDNYIFLETSSFSEKDINIKLTSKKGRVFKKIKEEFKNELINNTLRYNIAKENKEIREYIVKGALFFSRPGEALDEFLLKDLKNKQAQGWEEDSLGIAVPWGGKNKKKQN